MVEKHLNLLGLRVKDKATKYTGVVQSVCFDLFGCIQADVRPEELDKDGKVQGGYWLDINRLEIVDKVPVMNVPRYDYGYIAEGQQGSADKSWRA